MRPSPRAPGVLALALIAGAAPSQWTALPDVPVAPGPFELLPCGEAVVAFGAPARGGAGWRAAVLRGDAWSKLPAPPLSPRDRVVVRAVGDRLVVFGGREAATGRWCRDGAVLEVAAGRWRAMAAAPFAARPGMAVAEDGARLALVSGGGGFAYEDRGKVGEESAGGDLPAARDGAVYDVARDRWIALPELPVVGRQDARLVFAGDRLVLWGGVVPQFPIVVPQSDGAVLDLGAGDGADGNGANGGLRWATLPAAPIRAGNDAVIAADGASVLLFSRAQLGGWQVNGAQLDLGTARWRVLPPRDDFGISPAVAHATGDAVFVYSGRIGLAYEYDAWLWRAADAGWEQVQLPGTFAPREHPGVARRGARVAVIGGDRSTVLTIADGPAVAQPAVEQADVGAFFGDGFVVDLAAGSLRPVPTMPLPPRAAPAVAFVGDRLVVAGGHRHEREWFVDAAAFRLR